MERIQRRGEDCSTCKGTLKMPCEGCRQTNRCWVCGGLGYNTGGLILRDDCDECSGSGSMDCPDCAYLKLYIP